MKESDEYAISTIGGNTEERQESNANSEEKKNEISKTIELRLRFVELGKK